LTRKKSNRTHVGCKKKPTVHLNSECENDKTDNIDTQRTNLERHGDHNTLIPKAKNTGDNISFHSMADDLDTP